MYRDKTRNMRHCAYDVGVPVVLGIALVVLVARVAEDHLDLVFLLLGGVGVDIGGGLGLLLVELLEILHVVDVVGDLGAATGDADLVAGDAGLFLLLGARAVVGVGV